VLQLIGQAPLLPSSEEFLVSTSKSVDPFNSSRICFDQALRFSAGTMSFLKPNELNLGKGLTLPRIWS
ncbi:MAG: hypothetical protein AB7F94_16440, partial [Nitrospira sp.]